MDEGALQIIKLFCEIQNLARAEKINHFPLSSPSQNYSAVSSHNNLHEDEDETITHIETSISF